MRAAFKVDCTTVTGVIWLSDARIILVPADTRKSLISHVFDLSSHGWSSVDLAKHDNLLHRVVTTLHVQHKLTKTDLDYDLPAQVKDPIESNTARFIKEVDIAAATCSTIDGSVIASVVKSTKGHLSFGNAVAILSGSDPQRRSDARLWITGKNGLNKQDIGVLFASVDSSAPLPVSAMQWSPDGKRLLLVYGDYAYIVPIDSAARMHSSEN